MVSDSSSLMNPSSYSPSPSSSPPTSPTSSTPSLSSSLTSLPSPPKHHPSSPSPFSSSPHRLLFLAMEFDLQTEEYVKSSKEIDRLPWKGGSESNRQYEFLRGELRRTAPVNGRALLLFRSRWGCSVAKLEAWGAKRGRRHKKYVNVRPHYKT
ncbi:unnamed protein product [Eruca vesicaria subsp. sativa]|uniref:Uncharacterized protein n=1 Tax=Eruca vesicaria subsp. sativa TaxID=29727 RepID=A0ABC8MAJ2_ERUVS|nr:unnamed protein product [Eruca vesicaria subsp. sativa]